MQRWLLYFYYQIEHNQIYYSFIIQKKNGKKWEGKRERGGRTRELPALTQTQKAQQKVMYVQELVTHFI